MAKKLIYRDSAGAETEVSGFGGEGGGEPSQYLKDASVSAEGRTLTLTRKSGSDVVFAPKDYKVVDTFAGVTPEEGVLYLLRQDCTVDGVKYPKGLYFDKSDAFASAERCYLQDVSTLPDPADADQETVYRKSIAGNEIELYLLNPYKGAFEKIFPQGGGATEEAYPVSGQTSVTITHGVGIAHPYVVCVEDDGDTAYPAIEYVSATQMALAFSSPFTGNVYVSRNGGAAEQSFAVSGQTAVTITHTLGIAHPFVLCVDSDGDTVRGAVEYVDSTKFKIEFSTAFTGTVYIH